MVLVTGVLINSPNKSPEVELDAGALAAGSSETYCMLLWISPK